MLVFPGGRGGWLWKVYHELLKPDRRGRVEWLDALNQRIPSPYDMPGKPSAAGGGAPAGGTPGVRPGAKKESRPMGEQSSRKAENRRMRQQLGEQAGAAVAELHDLVAQTRLQHRALATEQLSLIDKVTTLQASRAADLARVRALEDGIKGAHAGLGELQDLVERVQLGLPDTIGAALLDKLVALKARLELGAEAATVRTSIYERLRWLVTGIVPRRVPGLDVIAVNADPGANRVIRRDPGGRLQAVP